MPVYQINKGINKPIEFKGLKAQYIGYLGIGLVTLLILFAVFYLTGVPVYVCLIFILIMGGLLFQQVYRFSNLYGQYGLMKKSAKAYLPRYLKFNSRKVFTQIKNRS